MNSRRLFLVLSLLSGVLLYGSEFGPGQTSSSPATAEKKATVQEAPKKPAVKKKKSGATKYRRVNKRRRKPMSPRVKRIRQAFVASTSLRPMARQLLQDRTPAAYAGVEAYARRHAKEDAGALAWLVAGYAHILDHDYPKAVDPLNRAKVHAGDLGEYVTYYLGTAYMQTGRTAEALGTLSNFETKYPDSLLIRDAHVIYANALMQDNRAPEAVTLLEQDREPARVDVEWNLGRAYEAAGDSAKAAAVFRNIYLTMPLAGEADAAAVELKKLGATTSVPPMTVEERRSRADLLAKGRRYADAEREYHDLINDAAPAERPDIMMAMASAQMRSGHGKDAKHLLESLQGLNDDQSAQRLYLLGEAARSADDDDAFLNMVGQLRQQSPNSRWLEQALLTQGNIYLLRRDFDHAIDAYRELQTRFPNGSRASYAHWKAAWLTLRQGRKDEAKKEFEEQIALYPASNEVPAAVYWLGRLAEDDGDNTKAQACFQKLSDRFRNYYYADLARKELKKLPGTTETVDYALLDKIPGIDLNQKIEDDDAPADNLRVQKASLLSNGALVDLAARELQAAAGEEKGTWVTPETARIYQENELYNRGIEVVKHAVPNYFALDLPALPRAYWEALFPRPYWNDLKRFSTRNELDPYLVASLIRQESEFNPGAVSNKNAVGLMQLLPKTGKLVAKEEKMRHFRANQLLTPSVNLQLGTKYFRTMVDKFGSFEYALAAYNAGDDRVKDWLSAGNFRDPQEFVESIPFTETREYVQAILRNASVYRQLYGTP